MAPPQSHSTRETLDEFASRLSFDVEIRRRRQKKRVETKHANIFRLNITEHQRPLSSLFVISHISTNIQSYVCPIHARARIRTQYGEYEVAYFPDYEAD